MKISRLLLLLSATLLATLLTACALAGAGGPITQEPQLGVPFTLKIWEEAILDEELTIWFESVVSDNRCPQNVECIVAGLAEITLGVRTPSGDPALLTLGTEPGTDTVTFQNYTIQLSALNPYPLDISPPLEDYEAILIITRTNN